MYHEKLQSSFYADTLNRFHFSTLQIQNLKTKLTKRSLRLALENVTNSVGEIYKDSYAIILAQPGAIASLAQKVLSWVTFTYRPLNLAELQHALAVESGDTDIDLEALPDEDVLVSSCGTFITYDRNTNEVRFVRKQFCSFNSIVHFMRLFSFHFLFLEGLAYRHRRFFSKRLSPKRGILHWTRS